MAVYTYSVETHYASLHSLTKQKCWANLRPVGEDSGHMKCIQTQTMQADRTHQESTNLPTNIFQMSHIFNPKYGFKILLGLCYHAEKKD